MASARQSDGSLLKTSALSTAMALHAASKSNQPYWLVTPWQVEPQSIAHLSCPARCCLEWLTLLEHLRLLEVGG